MKIRELFRKPVFWIAVCLMVCSGASELSMSQWASAYAEAALGLSKTIGDLAGPCMFAITMGISRMIFGKYGDKMDLMKFMAGSGILCVFCYLLASLSSNPAAGLIGCIVCGFLLESCGLVPSVFPLRNFQPRNRHVCPSCHGRRPWRQHTPGIVGRVTQNAGDNIRVGMGVGLIFPVVLLVMISAEKGESRGKITGI